MSIRGVPQLRQLLIRYSDRDGSSRGIREFLSRELVAFARQHEGVTIKTVLKRNLHPILTAEYVSGPSKTVCVKNLGVEQIGRHVEALRCTTGRKASKPLPGPVVSRQQSIQGTWDPALPMHKWQFTLQHE